MNFKRFLALSFVLILVLGLCACTVANSGSKQTDPVAEGSDPTAESTTKATDPAAKETEPADEETTEPTYVVTVQDQNGDPVVGAFVQLCLESCFPALTDENGAASFFLDEADYKVGFTVMPVGYEYVDDQQAWYFAEGENTMTIVINKIA